MSAHGGSSLASIDAPAPPPMRADGGVAAAALGVAPQADVPPSAGDGARPGFGHFIRPPAAAERYSIDGRRYDPSDLAARARADVLMRKLADAIETAPVPRGNEDGLARWFNRTMPSGFTYLLQLVAHDLVNSSVMLSRGAAPAFALTNLRSMPLRLETIYGGGPAACPHAYAPAADGTRVELRLGRTSDETGDRLRDIARGCAAPGPAGGGYPEALIADPRNDVHAILSQLVVLFHHLHNTILARLAKDAALPPMSDAVARAHRDFFAAQCASVLVYRAVIGADLMPRLLHPAVLDAYERGDVPLLHRGTGTDGARWAAPFELTHGVMRFGHAMIRPKYAFNARTPFAADSGAPDLAFDLRDVLATNSKHRPESMPLETKWTVDWTLFFGDGPQVSNFSVRIGPWSHRQLEKAIESDDPAGGTSLTYRDLMSAIAVQPWSVGALAAEIRRTHADLLSASPLLDAAAGERPWQAPIAAWLAERSPSLGDAFDAADIETLSADPPLPFFVRFEAFNGNPGGDGRHLGVFGSIVMADVVYGILRSDALPGTDPAMSLDRQYAGLADFVFQGLPEVFVELSAIRSMTQLIDWLGEAVAFPPDEPA